MRCRGLRIRRKMMRKVLFLAIILILIGVLPSYSGAQMPEGNCSGLRCDGNDGCIKDEKPPFEITVPEGTKIAEVWVKANLECRKYTQDGSDECYSVSGLGTRTVVVQKVGGDECHDISHIEAILRPTAVKLSKFEGSVAPGGVLLTWETISEVDNVGFNLYRSGEEGILGEQLNEELIPSESPGGGEGANYSFLDDTAQPGVKYYYTLEDVDANGWRTPHGPVVFTLWRAYLPLAFALPP